MIKYIVTFCVLVMYSSLTFAWDWDGIAVGKITELHISPSDVRIILEGVSSTCTGGENWAFLSDTDSNYKSYVAALLLAKAQGTTITVYTTLEGAYCHIYYIVLQ